MCRERCLKRVGEGGKIAAREHAYCLTSLLPTHHGARESPRTLTSLSHQTPRLPTVQCLLACPHARRRAPAPTHGEPAAPPARAATCEMGHISLCRTRSLVDIPLPLTTESPTTHYCPTPSQQTRLSSRCRSVLHERRVTALAPYAGVLLLSPSGLARRARRAVLSFGTDRSEGHGVGTRVGALWALRRAP